MTDPVTAMRLGPSSDRGEPVEIIVDGESVSAYSGETVATALVAAGRYTHQVHNGRPLAVFCNIGVCYSCLMTINGVSGERACQTRVADGLTVKTRCLTKGRLE